VRVATLAAPAGTVEQREVDRADPAENVTQQPVDHAPILPRQIRGQDG
jgi:hypothetical protein